MKHLTLLCYFTYLLFQAPPVLATTEEIYRFERLWPLLPQPWHFSGVGTLAISPQGHLYVVDGLRIQKFDLEGHYITEFGKLSNPQDDPQWVVDRIAIDSQEQIYVTYSNQLMDNDSSPATIRVVGYMIRKFDAYGTEMVSEEWTAFNQTLSPYYRGGLAIDHQNNVYLIYPHDQLQKLTSKGELLDQWPLGSGWERSIVIGTDSIYTVTSWLKTLISKYTLEGTLVKTWGGIGDQPGEFLTVADLAVDSQDHIYVVDPKTPSIQKFTADGQLLARWVEPHPEEVVMLTKKLADSPLRLFQYFIKQGGTQIPDYLKRIFQMDDDEQRALNVLNGFTPWGIAVDAQDNVYVGSDSPTNSIRKYTPDGRLLHQWASGGNQPGQLHFPMDIVRDHQGNLYIADLFNHRIVKLKQDSTGQFVTQPFVIQWGQETPEELVAPVSLAIDQEDNLYVMDLGTLHIQKFTAAGKFIRQWGGLSCEIPGVVEFYCTTSGESACSPELSVLVEQTKLTCSNDPGSFYLPTRIATDQDNNVYVVDTLAKKILQFSPNGEFLMALGVGELGFPLALKIDNHDNVYVTDLEQHTIKKYTTDGTFVTEWGNPQGCEKGQLGCATADGQLESPTTLATDEMGNVYVFDAAQYRIQKFTGDGKFVTRWGEFGSNPGQLGSTTGLAVSPNGDHVYVTDFTFNRVQVFNNTVYDVGKAIIVAGGWGEKDRLWDATQMVSNFAYQALLYQGFTKDTIYYLNANTNLDLDNNREFDDVDATSTGANLQQAITQWANDTDNLTLFLTDHGDRENFSFSNAELLSATELSDWLNTWQQEKNGEVKIIYDACKSGSFLPRFVPPAGQHRLVITSATADQLAYFNEGGSLSFSYLFWDEIFKGVDIGSAFTDTSNIVDSLKTQTPLLDGNGNGEGNESADLEAVTRKKVFIGNGTFTDNQAPKITEVPPQPLHQPNTPVTITAEVHGVNEVTRVWVVVRSPADLARIDKTTGTVTTLPSFDLTPVDDTKTHWKGTSSELKFDQEGTYFLTLYAHDSMGNTSQPQMTTMQVQNPLRHRALLIGGELPAGVHRDQEAYDALKYQGYTDEDIYYLSNLSSPGVDVPTTVDNIKFALLQWAQTNPTQDLIVYVEGVEAQGAVMLSATDVVTVEQLDEWLDTLQATLPGPVVVIYQGVLSEKLWSISTPPKSKTRIVISNSNLGEKDCLNSSVWHPLFAELFWWFLRQGEVNFLDTFNLVKRTLRNMNHPEPNLDANGNGIPNEKDDQIEAKKFRIGLGIVAAADEPRLGDISPTQVLQGDTTTATIMVNSVNSLGDIQQVTAEIKPPCDCQEAPATIELQPDSKGGYQESYTGFRSEGNYLVIISAVDTQGRKSLPKMTWVQRRLPLIPSQAKYHTGETVQVKLPSPLPDTEEQYLAVRLPDGRFYAIQGRNQFVPLGEKVPVWTGTGETVIDWQVAETLPKGEYRLYLVRVAKGSGLTWPVATELVRETRVVVE